MTVSIEDISWTDFLVDTKMQERFSWVFQWLRERSLRKMLRRFYRQD